MKGVDHTSNETLTLLEVVLRVQGDFRIHLASLRVTPLQAGVLLYLHRCPHARVKDAANAVSVRPPTLTPVINDLVRKRWVTRHRTPDDRRVLYVRLTQRGEVLVSRINERIRDVGRDLISMKEVSS